jgi:DNA-binding transcriptional LysR family regulator
LPAEHPLAGEKVISIEALRGERAILLNRLAIRGFSHFIGAIEERGFEVDDAHQSVASVFWHVAAGNGWAPAFGSQVRAAPPPGTVAVPLSDFAVETLVVARARASDRSRMTADVIDGLREAFGRSPAGRAGDPVRLPERVASRAIELRHLEALAAVCETRSLSRAAEQLGLTQSGISRRIASLEETLDVHLLERGNSGVLLTGAGRVLARHATAIIEQWRLLARPHLSAIARCRIAIVSTRINESAVLEVLHSLGADTCDVTEMLGPAVEEAVREGRADVGVCNGYARIEDPGIASMVLVDDAIDCALLPASHRLAGARSIRVSQLANDPFLFFAREDTPKLCDLALDELERAGYRPQVATTAKTPRAIATMVAASMGWSLALRSQMARPRPGLAVVPIEGFHIRAGAQLLWRRAEKNARILGVVRAFREWKVLARSA